ncbi:hypothetical protein BDZ89DRAFT_1091845 [Hymenopellis radicata]|nr:hypothetical protein BDZ89DRAFT_1091845 [Hymenopellis radicata]
MPNQYANNVDMRQQMSSPANAMAPNGHWPGMFNQTPHQRPMQPAQMTGHQQQFNQQWHQPLGAQSFPNAMRGMPLGMNGGMPFIPPQMMQDAMVIHKREEETLVRTLINAQTNRVSYREALNGLHGTNNHSASLWKDHYLEHKYRLDGDIAQYFNRLRNHSSHSAALVKKPSFPNLKLEPSVSPIASSSVPPSAARNRRTRNSSTPTAQPSSSTPTIGRRNTINSLTTHTAVFDRRLPQPHVDLKIPEPPSRSPTPPTLVIPKGRGNKFTEQDKTFFLKFISRRVKEDASLTRNDLCELLAEKARLTPFILPSCTQSWASYWSNNHDMPDKILAAAKGELGDDEDESEEERITKSRPRPKYKDISSDDDGGDEDDEDEDDEEAKHNDDEDAEGDDDDEADEDEDDEDVEIPPFDEEAMGPKGGPFTDADLAITARHIASFPDFSKVNFQDKWLPFGEKYPQRSAKSWAEYYRRNEKALETLARKIRKQNPPSKRKFQADDEDEDDEKDSKHPKLTS